MGRCGRIVNFRGLFVAAVFLLCAVFAALIFCVIPMLGVVLISAIIALSIALAIVFRERKDRLLAFVISAVICFAAFFSFVLTERNWTQPLDYSRPMSVVGTVESDIELDGTRRIYLRDVSLDGVRVDGRLLVFAKGGARTAAASGDSAAGEGFAAGSVVVFSAVIEPKELREGLHVFGKRFRDGQRYQAVADAAEIGVAAHRNPGFFVKVRAFMLRRLTMGLGKEYGELCYSFLTGDKAYLEIQVRNYFTAAGLAHTLAVSGLQLGFLSALTVFLCKRLRTRRAVTAVCVSVVLIGCAFLAGFSPSVCRAAIMSAVGVAVYLFGRRSDPLSSLSFAFCIIVTLAPFLMFEAGFVLSFCAVFGIILFKKPIESLLLSLNFRRRFVRFGGKGNSGTEDKLYTMEQFLKESRANRAKPDGQLEWAQNEDLHKNPHKNLHKNKHKYGNSNGNLPENPLVNSSEFMRGEREENSRVSRGGATSNGGLPFVMWSSLRLYKLRKKVKKRLINALAFGVSVHIGILPALVYLFNNFQPYGIIVNILLLPLVAFTFISAVICLILTIIVPPLRFVFIVPKLGFLAIDIAAEAAAKLPFARVVLYALPLIFAVYALYFLCSGFVRLPKKRVIRVVVAAVCIAVLFVQSPAKVDSASVCALDIGSSAVTLITDDRGAYLVGDIWSGHLILNELKERRVRRLDAVFVEKLDYQTAVQLQVLSGLYSDFQVYYPDTTAPPKDTDEWLALSKKLTAISITPFTGTDSDAVSVVSLVGGAGGNFGAGGTVFEAVFVSGRFSAYGFRRLGLESQVNVLLPRMGFRYDRFALIGEYNIIRALHYYDAGDRLYIIGEMGDSENVPNVYQTDKNSSYNYKTYEFY